MPAATAWSCAASAGCARRRCAKLRRDQIDLYPAYDGSLLRYLVGTSKERLAPGLRHTLARIDAEPMRLARAQNRNVFVVKSATASALSLARISDLSRFWGARLSARSGIASHPAARETRR